MTGTALVVGGTGMLAHATRWLVARHDQVLLVSRHAARFVAGEPDGAAYAPLDLDWDDPAFATTVAAAARAHPPVTTCLLWSHRPEDLLAGLAPLAATARTVLVLASTQDALRGPARRSGVTTVRLGSVVEGDDRRWLSDHEITDAVVAALGDGRERLVGDPVPVPD